MVYYEDMNQAIIDYIDAHIPNFKNRVQIGTVYGGRVVIGEKSYQYIPTVDMYFGDGDRVACILPEQTNSAAVVGVL